MFQHLDRIGKLFAMKAFSLLPHERIGRARVDLRMGVPVILTGSAGRAIVMSAETLTDDRFSALSGMINQGRPLLAITSWRAKTLNAMAYDHDIARIRLPRDANAKWVRAVVDPSQDLNNPMKGPFKMERGSDASFARVGIQLAKDAHLLPAVLMQNVTDDFQLPDCTVLDADLIAAHLGHGMPMHPMVSARVPIMSHDAGRVHVFRPVDGGEEHYAIEIGTPDRNKPVLARLHSACFTGDVIGSLKCDCGPQLRGALAQMGAEGEGVLLYLNQEGRGIGLANKMRAYALQDQGFDTVDANHRLGFEDDERDFRIGADILNRMGFASTRLLTNNPAKIAMMEAQGIEVVERVPLRTGHTSENSAYLATKAARSGHLL